MINNKFYIFLFIALLFYCLSCSDRLKKADFKRRQAFMTLIDQLKSREIDSLKHLFVDRDNTQVNYVLHNIDDAIYIVSNSNGLISTDSIRTNDSIIRIDDKMLYKCSMRFYKDGNYTGIITISFFGKDSYSPINLYAEREFNGIDTAGLLEEIMNK